MLELDDPLYQLDGNSLRSLPSLTLRPVSCRKMRKRRLMASQGCHDPFGDALFILLMPTRGNCPRDTSGIHNGNQVSSFVLFMTSAGYELVNEVQCAILLTTYETELLQLLAANLSIDSTRAS